MGIVDWLLPVTRVKPSASFSVLRRGAVVTPDPIGEPGGDEKEEEGDDWCGAGVEGTATVEGDVEKDRVEGDEKEEDEGAENEEEENEEEKEEV